MKDHDAIAAYPLVAVAISKDKSSQNALKWAVDNLVAKGQTLTLVHVNIQASGFDYLISFIIRFRSFGRW